jgi:predicted metal-dependent phosphoesterase TrpH
MWSDGMLTPWGLVLEAERQGLDAIAITGHNEVVDGKLGRWFSRLVNGPLILAGEEILAEPRYHLIAAGIDEKVSFLKSAASAIDDIHRQGGIAIAAHPTTTGGGPGYDEDAIRRLDGAEICHPLIYALDRARNELEQFAARGPVAAIGSSDFHGMGRIGLCRTYVFAREESVPAILDAVRAHRTVVYGGEGHAYGDAALTALADQVPALRAAAQPDSRGTSADWFSRVAGLAGLAGLFVVGRGRS